MKTILFRINIFTYFVLLFALIAGYFKNIFILYLIVLIHELGHVFFFLLFGIKVDKVVIYPFGGMTFIDCGYHENIYKMIISSLGGVFFQLLLFYLLKMFCYLGLISLNTFNLFSLYNRILIIFNLLPIIPLDGSRIVFYLLTIFLSFRKSYIITYIVSFVFLIMFVFFNISLKLNSLLIILFLFYKLYLFIKDYSFCFNKFLLERVLRNHHYSNIKSGVYTPCDFKVNTYYYIYKKGRYFNEKDFLSNFYFKR